MYGQMKLGRISRDIPPGTPDFRSHAIASALAPEVLDRRTSTFQPMMDGNDRLSDCTAVGLANAIRAQAALMGYGVAIEEHQTIDFYARSCGYDASNPVTDIGGIEVDVLAYQSRHGFAATAQTPYVGLWGNVEVGDLNLIRLLMSRLGSAYLGLRLALADQGGEVWDTDTPASAGDPTPGSWGGHCLLAFDYDGTEPTSIVRLATWGVFQRCTWRWLISRMEEAHGLYHPQMFSAQGTNWTGIDRLRLAADNAAFTSRVL